MHNVDRDGCIENRGGAGVTVRIGFETDGVLADFAKAYREVETSLFDGSTIEYLRLSEWITSRGIELYSAWDYQLESGCGANFLACRRDWCEKFPQVE
jgi:hypothetical protein